jgi:hypothetical protein
MVEIPGSGLLSQIFGRWPSFHDAEVVRIALGRTADSAASPVCEIDIHLSEATSELDERGHYVRRHHTLVTLRLEGVGESELGGFNNQNVLFDLTIEAIDRIQGDTLKYELTLEPSYGLSARIACASLAVTAARAWNPQTSSPAA